MKKEGVKFIKHPLDKIKKTCIIRYREYHRKRRKARFQKEDRMAKKKKVKFPEGLVMALFMVALGILFLVMKSGVIGLAVTILGVALLVSAVLDFLNKDLTSCIIKAVIGVCVLVFGHLFVDVAVIVVAAVVLVYGILDIVDLVKAKKKDVVDFIKPVVVVVIAAALLISKWLVFDWLFIVIGILFLAEGVLGAWKELKK